MNRVQGDYFETLLYKIFVSIDEQTNVSEVHILFSLCSALEMPSRFLSVILLVFETLIQLFRLSFQLANVLEIDLGLVKVRVMQG